MSVINGNQYLTLAEVNKAAGYDDAAAVLGGLAQRNEFMDELIWLPATHGSHNEQYQAARLGKGAFAAANSAISSISSAGDILKEPVRLYHADSEVGEVILKGADDPYRVRDSQDAMNLEGIIQDWNTQIMYADESATPDAFKSFSRRRGSLVAGRCVGGGGTGSDLTSLMLFEFSPAGVHMVYNKNGVPGIVNEDRGKLKVTAPTGSGQYWAWVRHYEIWGGIVVRNERALLRYANIETAGSSNTFDATTFINLKANLPSFGRGAVAFGNRTLVGQIEAAAYNKSNASYSLRDIANFGPVLHVAGVPVRIWEAIVDTETALTA